MNRLFGRLCDDAPSWLWNSVVVGCAALFGGAIIVGLVLSSIGLHW